MLNDEIVGHKIKQISRVLFWVFTVGCVIGCVVSIFVLVGGMGHNSSDYPFRTEAAYSIWDVLFTALKWFLVWFFGRLVFYLTYGFGMIVNSVTNVERGIYELTQDDELEDDVAVRGNSTSRGGKINETWG